MTGPELGPAKPVAGTGGGPGTPQPRRWTVPDLPPPRDETYRATLPARTPDGEQATLIVTRHGLGHAARTWLTFDGGWRSTAVLTDGQSARLVGMLDEAEGRGE